MSDGREFVPDPNLVFTMKIFRLQGHHVQKVEVKIVSCENICRALRYQEFYSKCNLGIFNNFAK